MVILGLGSNIDDRLAHLRLALSLIKQIPHLTVEQVSPVYVSDALLPDNAPVSWDKPYFNLALRCETSLSPYELLSHTKRIEQLVGRTPNANWGPRVVDIDLLAWDDLIQYDEKLHIPHEELTHRPFALWPLADVAPFWIHPLPGPWQGKTAAEIAMQWGSRLDGSAPLHTKQIAHRIDTPVLVGILNLTPDSFSDGGRLSDQSTALRQAQHLVETGSDILDIGAEATGPKALPISPEQEWMRLEFFLTELLQKKSDWLIQPKISVDTRHPETAKKALALGVNWINDVSGLDNPLMREVIADITCDVVFMHHLGIPTQSDRVLPWDKDPIDSILAWAENRLAELDKQGIVRDRLIFDVGIGFGKTAEQSLALIQQAYRFHALGVRLLFGHSRKSFMRLLTDKSASARDIETAAISLQLAQQKVHYLRVHNTEIHSRVFKAEQAASYA